MTLYDTFLCWLEVYAIGSFFGCIAYIIWMAPLEYFINIPAITIDEAYRNPSLKWRKVVGRFYGYYPYETENASIDLCFPIKINRLTRVIYARSVLTYSDEVVFFGRVKVNPNGGVIDQVSIISTTSSLWVGRYKRKFLRHCCLFSIGGVMVWKIVVVASSGIVVWL